MRFGPYESVTVGDPASIFAKGTVPPFGTGWRPTDAAADPDRLIDLQPMDR